MNWYNKSQEENIDKNSIPKDNEKEEQLTKTYWKAHVSEDFVENPSLISHNGVGKGGHLFSNFDQMIKIIGKDKYWVVPIQMSDDEVNLIEDGIFEAKINKLSTENFQPVSYYLKNLEEQPFKQLEQEQKPLGIDSYITINNNGNIVLHNLRVEKDKRKQGLGSAFMEELCNKADSMGKTIELNLGDKSSGETTSKSRLIDFYRRFGFVRNFGRTKDYRLNCQMYRRPKNTKNIKAFNLKKSKIIS